MWQKYAHFKNYKNVHNGHDCGGSDKLGFWVPVQSLLLNLIVPVRYMALFYKVLINNLSFQINFFIYIVLFWVLAYALKFTSIVVVFS
jgi:hypothetical protein